MGAGRRRAERRARAIATANLVASIGPSRRPASCCATCPPRVARRTLDDPPYDWSRRVRRPPGRCAAALAARPLAPPASVLLPARWKELAPTCHGGPRQCLLATGSAGLLGRRSHKVQPARWVLLQVLERLRRPLAVVHIKSDPAAARTSIPAGPSRHDHTVSGTVVPSGSPRTLGPT
jgi:hypothetical protein